MIVNNPGEDFAIYLMHSSMGPEKLESTRSASEPVGEIIHTGVGEEKPQQRSRLHTDRRAVIFKQTPLFAT
ncbi:hypothetical protein [Paenibacillus sp. HW567]|uniref:hypothetical protein n=1 Tax=Paenibacillus sp. HW567 TaxID=1034769 RepID=UPI00037EDE31|nr:hypothetical protein [Paenibacillus sp. HW567]